MNKYIIKSSLLSNILTYVIFAICSAGLIVSVMWIYPNMIKDNTFADLLAALPKEMLDSFGLVGDVNKLTDFLYMNYYNALYLYIMIVFNLIIITRLISKPVSDTSLVYYLSSPVARKTFFVSQAIVYVIGIIFMTVSSVLVGMLTHWALLKDYEFDIASFVKINIVICVLFLLLGSICLLICSKCNNNSSALGYCSGIMVIQYLLYMLKNMNIKFENLKYFTVFSMYDTDKIQADSHFFVGCTLVCLIVSIVLVSIAAENFKRRDLYL